MEKNSLTFKKKLDCQGVTIAGVIEMEYAEFL